MNNRLIYSAFLAISITCNAQSIDNILNNVEANNATLKALREQTDAEKYEAHTGISLSDPNVGVNYLWGNPSDLESNRFDLSVSQEFDFPTVYQYRRKVADGIANMADMRYLIARREVLASTAETFIQIAYCKAMGKILNEQCTMTAMVLDGTKKRYTAGEATVMDFNRAKTAYLNAQKAKSLNDIETQKAIDDLTLMNGGKTIAIEDIKLVIRDVDTNFEQWYSAVANSNPELLIEMLNIEQADNNIKLQKAQNLPKFSLGYMSERTDETTLQGVSFEMSIPIFERKNSMRAAKAQKTAAEAQMAATTLKVKNELKALHAKAVTLASIASEKESLLSECNNTQQLTKAFESNQINIVDFSADMQEYFDMQIETLDTKKEAAMAIEALKIYEK